MQWLYAKNFGELPSGEAERVEALVAIAEQLERIANVLELYSEKADNPFLLHGDELNRAIRAKAEGK